jgi:integrase
MDRFDRVPRDSQRSGDVVAVYRREKQRVTVTEADLKEILSTVRTRKYTILFALLAGTGLRIGEALALRTTNFGPDCRVLHVEASGAGRSSSQKRRMPCGCWTFPKFSQRSFETSSEASMAISSQPRKANHYSDEMSCEFYTA